MLVRQTLIDGSYTLYSVAISITRNGITILNTTSIRAENDEQARAGALRMAQETYPYPNTAYTVAVVPIGLEMFSEC